MKCKRYTIGLFVPLILVAGCTLAPEYERPESPVPAQFPTGSAYAEPTAKSAVLPAADELPWQQFFADEKLQQVIALSLQNNRDLQVATLNVERARALHGVQMSALFPTINGTASAYGERIPADLSGTGSSTIAREYSVGLGFASWELDVFGRIRSLSDAAMEDFLATEQAEHSVQIMLIAEVARAYLTLAANKQNLQLAQQTLEAHHNTYNLVQQRLDRGLVPELDLYQAQTEVDNARRSVARYTQLVAQGENALNLLVGDSVPDNLLPEDLAAVAPPREFAAGISSDVLLTRPDILEAEHRLKAANANIGAARAAFFPRISLTSSVGTASKELSGLFLGGSGVWSYAPQIVLPIFDPRTWYDMEVSEVDRDIAVAKYEKAIQSSFREVADALATNGTINEQVASQQSLVHATEQTFRLSSARYDRGVDSYLDVLVAQRSLFTAQQGLIALQLEQLSNRVTLYAVLGGGWIPSDSDNEASARADHEEAFASTQSIHP